MSLQSLQRGQFRGALAIREGASNYLECDGLAFRSHGGQDFKDLVLVRGSARNTHVEDLRDLAGHFRKIWARPGQESHRMLFGISDLLHIFHKNWDELLASYFRIKPPKQPGSAEHRVRFARPQ